MLEQRSGCGFELEQEAEEAGISAEGNGEKGGAHGKRGGDGEAATSTPQHTTRKCSCGKDDV